MTSSEGLHVGTVPAQCRDTPYIKKRTPLGLSLHKQAQICAEGCEEDDITHFFHIKCKHKFCTFVHLRKL